MGAINTIHVKKPASDQFRSFTHINDITQRFISYADFIAGEAELLSRFSKATQQAIPWLYNSPICLLLHPAGRADSLWNAYFQQTLQGQEESKEQKVQIKKQTFSAIQKPRAIICLSCHTHQQVS